MLRTTQFMQQIHGSDQFDSDLKQGLANYFALRTDLGLELFVDHPSIKKRMFGDGILNHQISAA